MPNKKTKNLDQEKIYKILSQGIVLTMEDDLKDASARLSMNAHLIPEQKKEEVIKEVFIEKPIFDPFKSIENSAEKLPQEKEPEKEKVAEKLPEKKEDFEQKFLDIISNLKNINSNEAPLLQKRKAILEKIETQKRAFESFFQKTELIKLEQVALEKKEQDANDSLIKHNLEEQRWQIEEMLGKAQDLQWTQEEEIEKAQMALSKVDNDLKNLLEQKTKLEKEKLETQKVLENNNFLKQKEEFLNKNQSFLDQKSQIETSYKETLSQKDKHEQDLSFITQEEQKIENDLKILEEKIQKVTDSGERRKLEQERREISLKRQLQEKKRWEFEKNQETIKNSFNIANEKLSKLKQEEDVFNQKVAEIEAKIDRKILLPVEVKKEEQIENVDEREKEIIEEIRLGAKQREQELLGEQFVQKQITQEKKATQDEFKQKQDDENREQAIAKLKQIAQQEQSKAFMGKLRGPLLKEEILKKLTKVSLQEENQRKEFLDRINKKVNFLPKSKQKGFEEGVIFHPMIKKTSSLEKFAVRFFIIFIIIGIGVGIYFGVLWLTKKQEINIPIINNNATTTPNSTNDWPNLYPNSSTTASSTAPIATTTLPVATTTEQSTTTPIVLIPPASLIPVSKNNIFSYDGDSLSLASSTKTVFNKKIQYNTFEQITVLDSNENIFLTPAYFFKALGDSLPQEIFNDAGTSTILIYSSKYGNRLGFALTTNSTSSLLVAFNGWEGQAEASTANIFNLMGKKAPSISKVFKNVTYKKVAIRCQAFTVADFGICYAVYKNYFILTSAYEQMQRLVDKLP